MTRPRVSRLVMVLAAGGALLPTTVPMHALTHLGATTVGASATRHDEGSTVEPNNGVCYVVCLPGSPFTGD
jgi:hypothetical protein